MYPVCGENCQGLRVVDEAGKMKGFYDREREAFMNSVWCTIECQIGDSKEGRK
jgi:hypothetical protein